MHKGLGRGIPNKCLPLDFMGYYALAGKEQETARSGHSKWWVSLKTKCVPVYVPRAKGKTRPYKQALTAFRLVETAPLFLLITPCPHEGRTICNRPCSGEWRQLLGLRHIFRRFCGMHHIFGELVEKCWRERVSVAARWSLECLSRRNNSLN